MDCKTALALLEPYLDNELDRADGLMVEAAEQQGYALTPVRLGDQPL